MEIAASDFLEGMLWLLDSDSFVASRLVSKTFREVADELAVRHALPAMCQLQSLRCKLTNRQADMKFACFDVDHARTELRLAKGYEERYEAIFLLDMCNRSLDIATLEFSDMLDLVLVDISSIRRRLGFCSRVRVALSAEDACVRDAVSPVDSSESLSMASGVTSFITQTDTRKV